MRSLLLFLIFLAQSPAQCAGQSLQWQNILTQTDASFRGLSVVDDSVAWVSGSKGWVGRSVDGGHNWTFKQVKGYEQCDFRSLYACNDKYAIIANAGSPAYILRTQDGGESWEKMYEDKDTAAFFDGIASIACKHSIVYGDPKNGRLELLRSDDAGKTWWRLPNRPQLAEGEASFAASGTTIQKTGRRVVIATGGKVSRLFISRNSGETWKDIPTPIIQGQSTTGIFSVACYSKKKMIIVGGDYKRDTLKKDHVFYTTNGGKKWYAPVRPTRGYRECVTFISDDTVVALGPTGTDISFDGGRNWYVENDEKQYHVIKKARHGNMIIAAGGGGKLALIVPPLKIVPIPLTD